MLVASCRNTCSKHKRRPRPPLTSAFSRLMMKGTKMRVTKNKRWNCGKLSRKRRLASKLSIARM